MMGVYAITQQTTGIAYVGSSVNIMRRWRRHRSDLACNRHHCRWLQRAWSKSGAEDFQFIVLEEITSEANLVAGEAAWLAKQPSAFNGMRPDVLRGVIRHGAATREQMSLAQRERFSRAPPGPLSAEQRAAIGDVHRGKRVSNETRAKQSAAAKARSTSERMRELGARSVGRHRRTAA